METMTQIATNLFRRLSSDAEIQRLATGTKEEFEEALLGVIRGKVEAYGADMARAYEWLALLCETEPTKVRKAFLGLGLREKTLEAVAARG